MEATAALTARAFEREFGRPPEVVASAPGRVNLVGEHTDYNDGFVLPMAIDRRLWVAMGAAATPGSNANGADRGAVGETGAAGAVGAVGFGGSAGADQSGSNRIVAALEELFVRAHPGASPVIVTVSSNVLEGAGLSSSAALEMAWLRARCELAGVAWDALAMARLAQQAETQATGVRCGIMDQVASASGVPGHALLLDCRSLATTPVALPASLAVVVMFTGVHRTLGATEYNERRASCEQAVRALQRLDPSVRALRDASLDLLARADVDDVTRRRARHVIEENARPAAMADALRAGDGAGAGRLMDASHASLRDLYEVSSAHLDLACDAAREHPGCFGARMTGAGFGGCAIALVRADAVDDFIRFAQPRYEARSYKKAEFFAVTADAGARVEKV